MKINKVQHYLYNKCTCVCKMYIIRAPVFKKCAFLKFRSYYEYKVYWIEICAENSMLFTFSDHNMAAVPVRGKQRSERCATLRWDLYSIWILNVIVCTVTYLLVYFWHHFMESGIDCVYWYSVAMYWRRRRLSQEAVSLVQRKTIPRLAAWLEA